MDGWKQTLAAASTGRTVDRARTSLGHEIEYKLGKGGFDPAAPLTAQCDCSGFVAWCIGAPRELPPRSNRWLQTDTFWKGGAPVARDLFEQVPAASAQAGDLTVYPDGAWGQGHIGIVTAAVQGAVTRVIHCSSSNWKNHGDAIRETEPTPWQDANKHPRIVRVNYDRVRQQFGIQAAVVDAATPVLHALLGNDPALQQVAMGRLVLTSTGGQMSGIGTIQDAFEVLARDRPQYAIALGPNRRYRGFFGPKTAVVVRQFQTDTGLQRTGEVDAETLLGLSRALAESEFERTTDEAVASTGEIVFSLRRSDRDWYATPKGGQEFYVGKRVKYQPKAAAKLRFGLMNSHRVGSMQRYDPEADYATPFGHWRYMVASTALCESGGQMACVNTYDRAYFTFGFCQFAAHVSGGDFVRFFRRLLQDVPSAGKYFSDLALNADGHISRRIDGGLRDLEVEAEDNAAGDNGVTGLMRYLNPSGSEVEEAEILNAARFIHWCENDAEMRKVMVAEGVAAMKSKLKQQNTSRPFRNTRHPNPLDTLCIALIDILHHEGSKFSKVNAILAGEPDEEKALLALCNAGVDPGRNKKLLNGVTDLRNKGVLGRTRFDNLTL